MDLLEYYDLELDMGKEALSIRNGFQKELAKFRKENGLNNFHLNAHPNRPRLDQWVRDYFAYERRRRDILFEREPEVWLRYIEAISDENIRNRAACIVDWDYFTNRKASTVSRILEPYITTNYCLVNVRMLAFELWKMGYPAKQALIRATPAKETVRYANKFYV